MTIISPHLGHFLGMNFISSDLSFITNLSILLVLYLTDKILIQREDDERKNIEIIQEN